MKNITELRIDSVKRIKAVSITPDGNQVVIGGRNAQGKSSVLDAIEMALGGKKSIPGKPIRHGEDKARIVVEFDDLIVTRTFTEAGSYLAVTNKDGAKYGSGQAILDDLVGRLSLDPLAFTRLKPADQANTLRKLVGIDTSELDDSRDRAYEDRTNHNRISKGLKARLDGLTYHDGMPGEEMSMASLVDEINAANKNNDEITRKRAEVSSKQARLCEIETQIESLNREYGQIEDENETLAAETELLGDPIDIDEISKQIQGCEETNRKVRDNTQYASLVKELQASESKSESRNRELLDIDARKAAMLASAKYPIGGIGIGDDGSMTYNGIPFDQASAAEQLRVSAAMGLALNPKLGVLLIRDGSLLDEDSLAELERFAEENDAQVWIERVGNGDECTVVIEDGMVASDRQAFAYKERKSE